MIRSFDGHRADDRRIVNSVGGMGVRTDAGSPDEATSDERRWVLPERSRARIQAIGGTAFVVVALCFGLGALWSRRAEFSSALGLLSPLGIVASVALSLVGVLLSAQVWMSAIKAVGGAFEETLGRRVFFATQIGKYLPGMAWPYLAQLRFARRFAISKSTMAAGQAFFLVVHVSTGALITVVALPWLVSADRLPRGYLVVLAPAIAAAVALHPTVLRWAVNDVLLRRSPGEVAADTSSILHAVCWMAAAWLLYGAALAALVVPIASDPDMAWLLCVGGFAFAWVIGFLVIVAPAGAGAREVVLMGVLSAVVSPVQAAAVAVVSRVIMTLVDLSLGAAAALAARRDSERDSLDPVPQQRAAADVS